MNVWRLLLLLLGLLPTAVSTVTSGANNADFTLHLPLVRSPISLAPSTNLDVDAATYLGGVAADAATGVDVAPDRTVVMSGALPGHDPAGVTPVLLLGGGDGMVARFASDGRSLLSLTRIGDRVNDVAVAADGRIVVCGDFGVALLVPDAAAVEWHVAVGNGARCDTGSDGIGFYGRFHPDTGAILLGQFMLTRLSSGNGNSIQAHGIMADENGRMYVAGQAFASLENRSDRTINAIPVGPYSGGEPFLLIVTPDFRERIIWTPWAASSGAGGSPAFGVSVRGGTAATVVGLASGSGSLITVNPLQPGRGGDADAYIAVWRQRGE